MSAVRPNAASQVFNIPELLELILLSLPWERMYEEIHSTRLLLLAQTVSRTWQHLLHASPSIRHKVYMPNAVDFADIGTWLERSAFPPSQPNPWIPFLLMQRRSWGTSYPFDNSYSAYNLYPSQPKLWTFAIEISRSQRGDFPGPGTWLQMMASSPPFTHMYCTRAVYELGSGRAPFVTHLDYDPARSRWEQEHVKHNASGITLGDIVDAVNELFAKPSTSPVRWVRLESVRCPPKGQEANELYKDVTDGLPQTRDILPRSSARSWGQIDQ